MTWRLLGLSYMDLVYSNVPLKTNVANVRKRGRKIKNDKKEYLSVVAQFEHGCTNDSRAYYNAPHKLDNPIVTILKCIFW